MQKPLLTYAVAAYKQEAFIRETVQNALAQTYSPLEIIISDDCSPDRTFDIARETAAAYKGPHTIRLNRMERNLGIAGHVNQIMQLGHGELVVAAAGDDLSVPERTEVIYRAWEQSGRRATSIFSSYSIMSAEGIVEGLGGLRGDPTDATPLRVLKGNLFDYLSRKQPVVNGCTHAWSPVLFTYFGPLVSDLEDLTLSFRSLAIAELLYIHQPLVKYRRHEANVSFLAEKDDTRSFEHREKRLRWVDEQSIRAYDSMLGDVETLCQRGRIPATERDRLVVEARRMRKGYALERQMMDSSLVRRMRTLTGAAFRGDLRGAVRSIPRALPYGLYRSLFLLRARWRASRA